MLKTLILKNLILIESAEISFEQGLIIITGETGSGKTAILEAIKLLLGERTDATKVRKGAEKALIQGEFDLGANSLLRPFLEEHGITLESENVCQITREIHSNGKSRSFIEGQLVPLNLLQKIAPYLIEIVDQHAHVALRSEEEQRSLVDLFAGLIPSLQKFQKAWNQEKSLYEKLEKQKEKKQQNQQRNLWLQESLDELKSANIQEKEEEKLFQEYTYLANIQHILENGSLSLEGLAAVLPQIFQLQTFLKDMSRYDSSFKEIYQSLKDCHLQLDEMNHFLQNNLGKIEGDSYRLAVVEERLKLIDKLKKKHGSDLQEIQIQFEKEWMQIEDVQTQIDQFQIEHEHAKQKAAEAAKALTAERSRAGQKLALLLSQNLQELNIPDAKVDIRIENCARTALGEDKVIFFLQSNAGEQSLQIKENASGGELARLLFCVKIALSNKNHAPTIIFDEIDANVGGKTADLMGEKLSELGQYKQILCITHFPQVAKYADHHFCITKQEEEGRTITKITRLDQDKKHQELLRMLGGNTIVRRENLFG